MAAIDFPTATSNGQTFEADSGVIYTYVGTPPNGFWSGTFATTGLNTLDSRYIAKNDENTIQTIQTQGLKFNSGNADTILLDGLNGKIGIGTTSPQDALHVAVPSAVLRLEDTDTNHISTIQSTAAALVLSADATNSVASSYLGLSVDGSEWLRIDSSGNIGIANSAYLGFNGASDETHSIQYDSGIDGVQIRGQNGIKFATASGSGTERMRIDSSGNVGINGAATANTSTKTLQVSDSTTARVLLDSTGTGGRKYGWYTSVDGQFAVYDYTANSERLRIDSSGNVGIGLTSPARPLDVSGVIQSQTSNVGGLFYGAYSGSTAGSQLGNLNFYGTDASVTAETAVRGLLDSGSLVSSHLTFSTSSSGSLSEKMRIDSSGNVGIGTGGPLGILQTSLNSTDGVGIFLENRADAGSSDAIGLAFTLRRAGGYQFTGTRIRGVKENAWTGTPSTINSAITFSTYKGETASEKMRIDSSGNVGIGTSSPQAITGYTVLTLNNATQGGAIEFKNNGTSYGRLLQGSSAVILETKQSIPLIFNTNDTERLRIDSSGRLLVGTTTEGYAGAETLTVANSLNAGITIRTGTSNNGSLAFSDGTSGVDEYRGLIQYRHADNSMNFFSNGAEMMRIISDGSGRILIGTSSIIGGSTKDSYYAKLTVRGRGDTTSQEGRIALVCDRGTSSIGNTTQIGNIFFSDADGNSYAGIEARCDGSPTSSSSPGYLSFSTTNYSDINPTERLRISAAGQVRASNALIASSGGLNSFYNGNSGIGLFNTNSYSNCGEHLEVGTDASKGWSSVYLNRYSWSSGTDTRMIAFSVNNSGVGSITATTSAVAYNTTSDYRLKENIVNITDGIPRVKLLQPKRFNFIDNAETTVDGFLAHEAQTVVPEAVTGRHNEVDDDGNPVMQGIDQAKLVPLLTAALQEAIAKIETLETKVAALEAA